jgi:hypothetical protein
MPAGGPGLEAARAGPAQPGRRPGAGSYFWPGVPEDAPDGWAFLHARRVARVYRPFVTGQRVAVLQAIRDHLASHGVPCTGPIPTLSGREWETFQGRAVEVEPYVAAAAAAVRGGGGSTGAG